MALKGVFNWLYSLLLPTRAVDARRGVLLVFFSDLLPLPPVVCSNMADINAIAKQFTDFYYATFDGNRAQLQGLYVRQDLS